LSEIGFFDYRIKSTSFLGALRHDYYRLEEDAAWQPVKDLQSQRDHRVLIGGMLNI